MRQESLVLLGFGVLFVLLLIAWRLAVTIDDSTKTARQKLAIQRVEEPKALKVTSGQLVTEIPERKETWTLQFTTSHYDPQRQVAITQDGVCQVTRNGKVVTVFRAPQIVVRFREREMEMSGGVTIVALQPKLRVNLKTLRWNWEVGQLRGTGQVKIDGKRFTAVANGLLGDTTLMQLSLVGDAKLEWHSESGDEK